MDSLIKSLPQVLRAAGDSSEVSEAAAIAAWKHSAGEGLRQHAIATKLEGQTLVIAVRDAIWQNQLATMKRHLIGRVNATLGQSLVNNIELRIVPKNFAPVPAQKDTAGEILDNEVPIDLWTAASAIEDKQLRQKFLKAAIGALKRKKI